MSFNQNFNGNSLIKPIIIVVAILLAIGGAYSFFGQKSGSENDMVKSKPSGIDSGKKVKNVGDVEEVIAKWVEANPEAIINAVANMQRKAMDEQRQSAQKSIPEKRSELFDSSSPSYTPKKYDVTVVEFFDYNCGYCKRSAPTIEELIAADSKVRIIYKEFPILGQGSEELTKVALAVNIIDPSSYRKFHNKLMSGNVSSTEDAIKLASSIGINAAKLRSTLESKKGKIAEMIEKNRQLGASIGIQGTPGFVIGDELIPGAVDLETLKQKVKAQR